MGITDQLIFKLPTVSCVMNVDIFEDKIWKKKKSFSPFFFNDYIFKDILNTIGPAVMGVKEDEEDLREVNNKRILRVELESSGTMLLELLDGLQNLDHNIKVRGK